MSAYGWEPLFLLLFFVLDAFYSASETAMTSLNSFKMAELSRRRPSYAAFLESYKANPSRLITTILVSSNLTVIGFSSVATALSFELAAGSSVGAALAATLSVSLSVVAVLCAEIAPKVVAKKRPDAVAELVLPGLKLTEALLGPFIRILVKFITWITRPFAGKPAEPDSVSEPELLHMVDEGARGGAIEKEEAGMIRSVIEFGDTVVSEVMVPKSEMAGVPINASVDQCLELFIEGGYSRLPVFDGSLADIRGILYAKDFLAMMKERDLILLQDVLRPVHFVQASKKVSELLREFRRGKGHLAIVVDETGATAGLVTLEDLVEEIVGDIRDEYDL